MLATACNSYGARHVGASYLLAIADVIVGHGGGLLKMLNGPLPTNLGTLLGVLGGDVGRCFFTIMWGWVKLGRLVAGSVLGGNAVQLLDGVPHSVGSCLKGWY
jgi:hypothetical protein